MLNVKQPWVSDDGIKLEQKMCSIKVFDTNSITTCIILPLSCYMLTDTLYIIRRKNGTTEIKKQF